MHRFASRLAGWGLAAFVACPVAVAQLAFAPHVLYDTPGWGDGWAVTFGDFDRDGDLDMAAASEYNPVDGRITVYQNNGAGVFSNPVYYSTGGTGPTGIVAADFNNDTWIDLAYCLFSPGSSVKVLLNDQSGGFVATQSLYSGNAVWIVAADFNGDGWMDVVSSNSQISGGTAKVFLNNGAGLLLVGVAHPVGFMPLGAAAADLDGDKDIDIAVTSRSTDAVSVLMNNGDGTFAPFQSHAVGETPQFVATGDLNGDQLPDLAVSSTGISFTSDVSILINNGLGGFQPQVTYDVGYDAAGILVEDLDNDGDNDVAVAVEPQSKVFVLSNNGNGALAAPMLFACGQPGDTSRAIIAADLDDNGQLDLAVSNMGINQGIAVLINLTPPIQIPGDCTGDGMVNVDDLTAVILAWGPCGSPCPADIAPAPSGNGVVNIDDLFMIIINWG